MKRAHFFDLDCILVTNSKVWLVDKNSPNIPILKISKSDFNLIKSGIYKNQNNNISIGGDNYWLSTDFIENLKITCKKYRCNISNLSFSLQEYMNKDIIDSIDYDINMDNIIHLKNTNDDIYFICSKNTERNYGSILKKIDQKLEDNGLIVKKYYYISETFYNRDRDNIAYKKVKLLLQYLIGLKTDDNKFIDENLEKYDEIYFYDNDISSIELSKNSNNMLQLLLDNTEASIKDSIKDILKSKNILYVNYVSDNKVNKFLTTKVELLYHNIIKTFENFKWKK